MSKVKEGGGKYATIRTDQFIPVYKYSFPVLPVTSSSTPRLNKSELHSASIFSLMKLDG